MQDHCHCLSMSIPAVGAGSSELPPSSDESGAAPSLCQTQPTAPPPWPPSAGLSSSPPPAPFQGPGRPPAPESELVAVSEQKPHDLMYDADKVTLPIFIYHTTDRMSDFNTLNKNSCTFSSLRPSSVSLWPSSRARVLAHLHSLARAHDNCLC